MRIKYDVKIKYQYYNIYDIVYSNEHINEMIKDYYCFKDDKQNGEYKFWWGNGRLWKHCYYKNNKRDGEYKEYDAFGSLCIYSIYKDDKLNGDYITYHINGSIDKHSYYKNDKIIKEV